MREARLGLFFINIIDATVYRCDAHSKRKPVHGRAVRTRRSLTPGHRARLARRFPDPRTRWFRNFVELARSRLA